MECMKKWKKKTTNQLLKINTNYIYTFAFPANAQRTSFVEGPQFRQTLAKMQTWLGVGESVIF